MFWTWLNLETVQVSAQCDSLVAIEYCIATKQKIVAGVIHGIHRSSIRFHLILLNASEIWLVKETKLAF